MNQVNSNESSLGISSRLLLDMKMSSTISGDSDMCAIQDQNGYTQLLVRNKKGNLVNIRRSSDDTGWEQNVMDVPIMISTFAIGSNAGQVIAFAAGANDASPEISYSIQDSNGNWGQWEPIVGNDQVPQQTKVTSLFPVQVNGKLELYGFLEGSPGSHNAGELSLWWIPWDTATEAWQQLGQPSGTLAAHGKLKGIGEGLLAFERSASDPTKFDLLLFPVPATGQPVAVQRATSAQCLATAIQDHGFSGLFYNEHSWQDGNDTLYFIDGGQEGAQAVAIDIKVTTGITQLAATDSSSSEPLTLFLLDSDKHLFVVRQPGANASWREPFELGDSYVSIAPAKNQMGVTEIFGFDPDDTLIRFWEIDDGSGNNQWKHEPITIPAEEVGEYSSYCTRMLVRDTEGNRMPNKEVTLYAGEITAVTVGGKGVVLGPSKGVSVNTDNSGYLVVYSTDESLSAAKLRVVIDNVMDTHVSRDLHSKSVLANSTESDIKGLLPEKYQSDAPQVHQAVQKVMSAVDGQPNDPNSFRDRIDVGLLPDDFDFRFDVGNGRAILTPLSPAESFDLVNSYRNAIEPMDWYSFWHWLGDIVESAAHAVESAFTYVVKKVAAGIQVVVDVVIRGVKYVFSGIVTLVEEAFGIVTAIFSSVMVFFKDLFKFVGWLVTDACKDIWATKTVISKSLTGLIPQVKELINQGEVKVGNFIDGLETKFDGVWDPLIAGLGNTTFSYSNSQSDFFRNNGTGANSSTQTIIEDHSATSNWFIDKMTGPNGGGTFIPDLAKKLLEDAMNLVKNLGDIITDSFRTQLNQFYDYLQNVVKNPKDFISLTVKEFLLEIKSLLHLVLKMMKAIAQGLLAIAGDIFEGLMTGILNQPITADFVVRIYNLINPGSDETPTLLDIFSLFAAIPSTVLFRAVEGHAPFTQADAAAFERSDVTPIEHIRRHGLSPDNPMADSGTMVVYKISSYMIIPYTLVEIAGDYASWSDYETPPTIGSEIVNFMCGILWPLAMLALAPAPWTWDTGENIWLNITWIGWLVPSILNIIWWLATAFKDLATGNPVGTVLYSISGLIVLIFGIITLVEEDRRNVAKGWLNIALPLPTLGKFLTLIKHPVSIAILMVLDGVCYLGSVISGLYLASNPEEPQGSFKVIAVDG